MLAKDLESNNTMNLNLLLRLAALGADLVPTVINGPVELSLGSGINPLQDPVDLIVSDFGAEIIL